LRDGHRVRRLLHDAEGCDWRRITWLGLLLMFYFMGLAKVGEPLFVFRMPPFIREVRDWEAKGDVYQRMGVQRFGQLLRASPFRLLNTSVYLANRPWDLHSLYRHAASFEATSCCADAWRRFWQGTVAGFPDRIPANTILAR